MRLAISLVYKGEIAERIMSFARNMTISNYYKGKQENGYAKTSQLYETMYKKI